MSYNEWIKNVEGLNGWEPVIERYNTLTFRNNYYPGICIWASPGFNHTNGLPISVVDEHGNEIHSASFGIKAWDFNKFQEMIDKAIQITEKKLGN